MELLEELMPGMGDVLFAQESALTSVIATLTTQLKQLAATNERQAQRVTHLESTQLSMRLMIRELQNAPTPAPVVIEAPSFEPPPPDTLIADAVAMLATKMEQLQQNVKDQVEQQVKEQVKEQIQQALVGLESPQVIDDAPAKALMEEKFRALDEKVSAQIGELRSEATDSLAERAKQTEETARTQLEQLEKRFDYLSRVKMEVKELIRRADQQEQSIEDVRTGIEMLAKSLGTDDVESETEDEKVDEEEVAEEKEEIPIQDIREVSRLSTPENQDTEELQLDLHIEAKEASIDGDDNLQCEEQDNATEVPTTELPPSSSSPLTLEFIAPTPELQPEPELLLVMSSEADDLPIPEAVDTSEVTPPADVQAPEPPQQFEDERTTEDFVIQEKPSTPTPVAVVAEAVAETVETTTAQQPPEIVKNGDNQEVTQEELPQQYRSHLATHHQEMNDQVELFRPPSSSVSRSSVVTPVVRTRHQRRSTINRKDVDIPSSDPSPPSAHENFPIPTRETLPIHSAIVTPPPSTPAPRVPLTKARIKELWFILLARLVRLQRLKQLNGLNAEKALFRPQQMSMGSRVKRLEENTVRIDESLEYLERRVRDNSSAINAMDENIAEFQPVVDRVQKMERTQKTQARTIVDVEEKLQEFDVEIQRLRTSVRTNNVSAVTNAMSAQLQDVSSKFSTQLVAFDAFEKLLTQVNEAEIPALHEKINLALYTLRQEAEQRTNESAQDLQKFVDQLQTAQETSDGKVLVRLTDFCSRIYHTLLGMSGAMLQSVDLGRIEQSTKNSTRTALAVGIELLHGIFTHFIANCSALTTREAAAEVNFLVETSMDFQQQLEKLKGQAAIAKAAVHLDAGGKNDRHGSTTTNNSSFDDHLVFITTTKLKELEGALITRETHREDNQIPELTLFMHDVVVQVRSVLFLLLLHTEAMKSRHQTEKLQSTQILVQSKMEEHAFALGHLDSTVALVKLMNTRLDTFLELSFAYAKEEDVKKSIEELMNSNNEMRELLTTSLEATRSETMERDGLLGEEMNQLIARVSKKLDKDELLWTQEVLERQVQNVANASLDEHDLVDIHRRLRRKLDKSQLKLLLQGQTGRMNSSLNLLKSAVDSTVENGDQKSAPLVGAKCISCHGELPPTKAMIQHVVREEVHQELAKSRAQKLPPSSMATFNASNHRNLETFKKELLLSSLQQKHAGK